MRSIRLDRSNHTSHLARLLAAGTMASVLVLGACGGDAYEEPEVGEVGAAPVAATSEFGAYDADADTRLTAAEFGPYWRERGVYNRWNTTTGDLGLTTNEYYTGAYNTWDRNEAGLTEAEWNEGVGGWFANGASYGTYTDWDADRSGLIDENEFMTGGERYGMFNAWDTNRDTYLDETEYDTGLFGVFDTNDDTYLDGNEWTAGYSGWDWGI